MDDCWCAQTIATLDRLIQTACQPGRGLRIELVLRLNVLGKPLRAFFGGLAARFP